MVNIIFPDGTTLVAVIANLNVFTSNPSTSIGEGEIIYNSTNNKTYVNIGTIGSPSWSDISGSSGAADHGGLTGLADNDHPQYLLTTSPNLPLSYSAGNLGLNWGSSLSLSGNDLVVNPANVDHGSLGGLSDDDHTQYLLINGSRAMSGNLDMDDNKIVGLDTPTAGTDAATKLYVDDAPSSDGVYICTSSTRPDSLEGRVIYETDTDDLLVCTDVTFELISGEQEGDFYGYYWSGSAWVSDSDIVDGLVDVGTSSTSCIFDDDGTWKLIAGAGDGAWDGYYWSGSAWVSDSDIVSGLADVGTASTPTIFDDDGTWKLITGKWEGTFTGYYWSGSAWVSDSDIIAGLVDVGYNSAPCVFDDNGTWKIIIGEWDGVWNGYYWNGSTWVSDSDIVSGLSDVGGFSKATIFDDGTLKLITGGENGAFTGYYWSGSAWVSDSSIVSGLSDIGMYSSPIVVKKEIGWSAVSEWVGTATSDLDLNGYDILDGSLGTDLDLNGYDILDGSLGTNLDANDFNIVNADTIQAKSTNSLTLKVSTGKSFVFQKV